MTFEKKALAAGGHLADDVAFVVVDESYDWGPEDLERATEALQIEREIFGTNLPSTLISEDTALD